MYTTDTLQIQLTLDGIRQQGTISISDVLFYDHRGKYSRWIRTGQIPVPQKYFI